MRVNNFMPQTLIQNLAHLSSFATMLAEKIHYGDVIFLYGDLGTGKTTFTRELLRAMGHEGAVKSPTYTLVESYQLPGGRVHHFDFYRVSDGEEIAYLGLGDYFDAQSLCLVEWPQVAMDWLPKPTWIFKLSGREDPEQRMIDWQHVDSEHELLM